MLICNKFAVLASKIICKPSDCYLQFSRVTATAKSDSI